MNDPFPERTRIQEQVRHGIVLDATSRKIISTTGRARTESKDCYKYTINPTIYARGENMKKEYLEIMDDMMNAVTQSDPLERMVMRDPWIKRAEANLHTQIDGLQNYEEIEDAVLDLANAYERVSVMYGIMVAQAIQAVSRNPALLTRHIMDRADAMRKGGTA